MWCHEFLWWHWNRNSQNTSNVISIDILFIQKCFLLIATKLLFVSYVINIASYNVQCISLCTMFLEMYNLSHNVQCISLRTMYLTIYNVSPNVQCISQCTMYLTMYNVSRYVQCISLCTMYVACTNDSRWDKRYSSQNYLLRFGGLYLVSTPKRPTIPLGDAYNAWVCPAYGWHSTVPRPAHPIYTVWYFLEMASKREQIVGSVPVK